MKGLDKDTFFFQSELNYSVHRRDREANETGQGVFILIKNTLVSARIVEAETNCEILWVKVACFKHH